MDRDEEKDLYIKSKIKDGHIPEKIDDLFNNSINVVNERGSKMEENKEKQEPQKIKSKNLWIKRTIATAACAVIVVGGANVYATTQGYDNIFFMIKYLVTGDKSTSDKNEILSDRDITISYEPIQITENIKILISKLQIKDNQAKLIVNVNKKDGEITKLSYKVYNSSDKKLCDQKSVKSEMKNEVEFTDELILDGFASDDKILNLEIYENDESLITTLEIDIENRTITVAGENEALKKISEIELKEFLGDIAGINRNEHTTYADEELMIGVAIEMTTKNSSIDSITGTTGNLAFKADEIYKAVESIFGKSVSDFIDGQIFMRTNIKGTKYFEFKEASDITFGKTCIDIPKISYCGGLYTITYTYCDLPDVPLFEIDINDYDIYQNTVMIKTNEDDTYSKFQVVSMEEPIIIKSNENKEEGTVEETTNTDTPTTDDVTDNNKPVDNTTNNSTENNDKTTNNNSSDSNSSTTNITGKVDNYASSMSWKEYWAPGLKIQYPTMFNLEEIGGYNRGNRFGEISTKITGVATGIDPDTKEIIKSNLTIEIYEPEFDDNNYDEIKYYKKKAEEYGITNMNFDLPMSGITTKSGLKWVVLGKLENGIKTDIYVNYDAAYGAQGKLEGIGRTIVFTYDNVSAEKTNYKVMNIINWVLGATQLGSF